MRKTRSLIILALVTLAVVIAAVISRQSSAPATADESPLLPGLTSRINQAATLTLKRHGTTVEVHRTAQGWAVKEESDYPADMAKLREYLVGLTQLRRIEPKTRKPANYAALDLTDIAKDGSLATDVTVADAKGKALAQLVVGKRRSAPGQPGMSDLYVRVPGNPQVWLVEGNLPTSYRPAGWLDPKLLSVGRERIHEVKISPAGKRSFTLDRHDRSGADFALLGLSGREHVKEQYAVNDIAERFTGLTLNDVKPAKDIDWPKTPALSAELTTFDGLRVDLETAKQGKSTWVRLHAAFDPSLVVAPAKTVPPATKTTGKGKATGKVAAKSAGGIKEPAHSAADVRKEAAQLDARWSGWVYQLPSWQLNALNKTRADLVAVKTVAHKKTKGRS